MTIILAMDGDKAGQEAAIRACLLIEKMKMDQDDITEEERLKAVPMALSWLNYRGIPTPDLICEIQKIKDEDHKTPSEIAYAEGQVDKIQKELERRRNMVYTGTATNNKDVIEAIKAKADIVDVIGRYTDVIVKSGKYWFRCKLHSEDKNPSASIDTNEGVWYCHGCGQGGDVFTFIELYERVQFPRALHILGQYTGINTQPSKPKQPKYIKSKGGINL